MLASLGARPGGFGGTGLFGQTPTLGAAGGATATGGGLFNQATPSQLRTSAGGLGGGGGIFGTAGSGKYARTVYTFSSQLYQHIVSCEGIGGLGGTGLVIGPAPSGTPIKFEVEI